MEVLVWVKAVLVDDGDGDGENRVTDVTGDPVVGRLARLGVGQAVTVTVTVIRDITGDGVGVVTARWMEKGVADSTSILGVGVGDGDGDGDGVGVGVAVQLVRWKKESETRQAY